MFTESLICNSAKLKIKQMFFNQRMLKNTVVQIFMLWNITQQ